MSRWGHRRSRRRVAGACALVAIAAAATATGSTAYAQDDPAANVSTAKATAVVVKVAPTVGALQLALGSGVSVAEVRNQLAQSQSQSLDLGLIGSALTAEQCDQKPAPLRPNDLPQALRIDNRGGEANAETAAAPALGSMVSGGLQQVLATPQPLAQAVSTAARISLSPLIDLAGGVASATTEVVDGGAARIAHATVTVDLDIPGVLRLSNLKWDAFHRSGTEADAHASFELGSIELLGIPIPTAGIPLETLVATINATVGPLGLTLQLPVLERFTEPADVVRMTPLRLRFGDSPIGALVTGPILDATRQLRDDLAAAVIAFYCRTSTAFLLAEIFIGQFSGVGSTVVSIGGAEATTGLVALENPFGDGGLLAPPVADVPAPDGTPLLAIPRRPTAPVPAPVTGGAQPELRAQPIGDFERVCESVHPFQWPSCSAGAAPFVGLAAVLATAAIGFLDWRHQRRRLRAAAPPADEPLP